MSTDKLPNVSQSGTSKNKTTAFIVKPQKLIFFFDEAKTIKNAKIMKRSHAYKGCASTYNVKLLNSLNPELQLKDTESIMKNKQEDLLS